MPHLTLADGRIFYETAGDAGPWLVLVNGHMRTHADFKLMARHFAAAGFRCLFFDNRGVGATESSGPFTMATMAADVLALADHVGAGAFHLLGISMGGLISLETAARAPERVMRMVLASTTADTRWITSDTEAPWGDTEATVLTKMRRYVSTSFLERNKLLVQAMAKQIHKEIVANAFLDRAAAQRDAIAGYSALPLLPRITTPTLVLHGAEDDVIRPDAARELAEGLPNATLRIVPDVGHLFLAEAPKAFYGMVEDFLRH